MNEIKFEDYLMFIEAKNRKIIDSILDECELSGKSISDSLSVIRDQELESQENNKLFSEFTENQKEYIKNRIIEMYNNPQKTKEMSSERDPKVVKFEEITKEMVDTYERKNHDYGDSFGESIKRYGLVAGLVRMSDKWNRLNSLIENNDQKVKDESIIDTLTDLACYAIMLRMEIPHE